MARPTLGSPLYLFAGSLFLGPYRIVLNEGKLPLKCHIIVPLPNVPFGQHCACMPPPLLPYRGYVSDRCVTSPSRS